MVPHFPVGPGVFGGASARVRTRALGREALAGVADNHSDGLATKIPQPIGWHRVSADLFDADGRF